jgi:hypothetical protein
VSQTRLLASVLAAVAASAATAAGLPAQELEEVVVRARRLELVGSVESASEGVVLPEQLEYRPELRPAEMLEVVPGLVVTQHSGDGKANQYFLRGFNLDHGTDFATRVDGVPVNLPTNAHGQGYTDLNFLVPEFVEQIAYRKGTYYAEEGNFSAAGAADIRYRRRLDAPFIGASAGADGYSRVLLGASPRLGDGDLLLGGEYLHNDGPWDLPEGYNRINGVAKFTRGDASTGWDAEAMGYDGHWRSSDQIPQRAVDQGLIDRFGAVDPTDRGDTHRYSLAAARWQPFGAGRLKASAYAFADALDLVSNFTYATDPVHGDQFEQTESRRTYGGTVDYQQSGSMWGREAQARAGIELRDDDIRPVALYRTTGGVRYGTVRRDDVTQVSYSAYATGSLRVAPWLRTDVGARFDSYHFRVDSSLPANSGTAADSIASPKLTLAFGPWDRTEFFLNYGRGFHSNDARGTTITVDPNDGVTPVARVSPLVRAVGAEAGLRSARLPGLQLALSLWTLALDSELVFSGDGGTTEPSRASRRTGVELGAFAAPLADLVVDADVAWTHARFTDPDPAGDRIPNAVETVVSAGASYDAGHGAFGGMRLRYFGPAPLIEDNGARSHSTLLLSLEGGWHVSPTLKLSATVFNLLNRRDNDITYFYASQLPGEAAPVDDYHFHPVEPRTVRVTATLQLR